VDRTGTLDPVSFFPLLLIWIAGVNAWFVDEILLSSDKTVAIIDGSGVLADPAGLNRVELVRLAKARIPVANFDTSKLSKDGYLVRVEDQDVKLPCKCPLVGRNDDSELIFVGI
jgi:hypothetical protein